MTIKELLHQLKEKNIKLWFEDGRIKYKGSRKYITNELLREIRKNKAELIRFLWPLPGSNLIPLQPLGEKPPFFFVHGDEANFFLSQYLGLDQPFYGFLHQGEDGKGMKYTTIVSIATEYIKQLLTIKPSGPYYLGGFSVGGVIAFEMANQLVGLGHKVVFLAMLDTIDPGYKSVLKGITPLPLYKKILRPPYRYLKWCICEWFLRVLKMPIPYNWRRFYILRVYKEAVNNYKPNVYRGAVTYFRATKSIYLNFGSSWGKYVKGPLQIFDIEGPHIALKKNPEAIEMIVKKLNSCLAEVRSSGSTKKSNFMSNHTLSKEVGKPSGYN